MSDLSPKLAIGIILYNQSTAKYLPYFLPSLKNQTFKDYTFFLVDNSDIQDNDSVKFLEKDFFPIGKDLRARFQYQWVEGNIGFARAYNIMIKKAVEQGARYFLATNADLVYEPDTIQRLVAAIEDEKDLGSVCPKIMRWNFAGQEKTDIIDTCGIKLLSGLRFIDVGQGEKNSGQFDQPEIIGPSGACALYKLSALQAVEQAGQYFDELMFMYKEDCDLAYRLHLAGYRSKCVAGALAYHDRTTVARGEKNIQIALNRKNKSRQAKEWSLLNQLIIYKKFWQKQNLPSKFNICWQLCKMLVFISVFEQYQFKQVKKYFKIKNQIKISK